MAQWSDWTPDVAIDVPSCPTISIERAVKFTVIDFLERTHWLQRTPAPINVTGGAAERTFASPVVGTGERVLAVLKAWYFDAPLDIYAPLEVEDDWPDWKTRLGTPEAIVLERIDTYYVVPSPSDNQTAALRLKVAIGLTETATTCDDSVRVNWRDVIASGVKAQLMLMQGKPWSSPELGSAHLGRYEAGIDAASVRVLRTHARRPLNTRPYFF